MPDHDAFDPDDNFANALIDDADIDEDASTEALVWQLLLLINPGDGETALQQFTAYRDALADDAADEVEPIWVLRDIIDWTSGFHVADDDNASLVDSLVELAARYDLRIDWDTEDPTDAEYLAGVDMSALVATAYDALRAYGYTVWLWDTGTAATAGFMTRSHDDEAMRAVAPALGIDVRHGNG